MEATKRKGGVWARERNREYVCVCVRRREVDAVDHSKKVLSGFTVIFRVDRTSSLGTVNMPNQHNLNAELVRRGFLDLGSSARKVVRQK